MRIVPARIVYITSDGNYSTFLLHDQTEQVFTMNLAHCQLLMERQLGSISSTFLRIGKSLIVNRHYIYKVNVSQQRLVMADMVQNDAFTLSASREAQEQLKAYMEKWKGGTE